MNSQYYITLKIFEISKLWKICYKRIIIITKNYRKSGFSFHKEIHTSKTNLQSLIVETYIPHALRKKHICKTFSNLFMNCNSVKPSFIFRLKLKSLIIRPSTRHLLLLYQKLFLLSYLVHSAAGDRTLFGCAKCVQGEVLRDASNENSAPTSAALQNIVRKRNKLFA